MDFSAPESYLDWNCWQIYWDWDKKVESSNAWIATIWDANIPSGAAILWKTISRIQSCVQVNNLEIAIFSIKKEIHLHQSLHHFQECQFAPHRLSHLVAGTNEGILKPMPPANQHLHWIFRLIVHNNYFLQRSNIVDNWARMVLYIEKLIKHFTILHSKPATIDNLFEGQFNDKGETLFWFPGIQ